MSINREARAAVREEIRYCVIGEGTAADAAGCMIAAAHGSQVTRFDATRRVNQTRKVTVTNEGVSESGTIISIQQVATVNAGGIRDAYMIVDTSGALEKLLAECGPSISGGQLLLAPGGAGGVARTKRWFISHGLKVPALGELPGFICLGRWTDGRMEIGPVKRNQPLGVETRLDGELLLATWGPVLPGVCLDRVVFTGLSNTNHIIHPAVSIANLNAIAHGISFRFYRDGLSIATERLLEAVDSERVDVLRALGVDTRSTLELLKAFYSHQGGDGYCINDLLRQFSYFKNVMAPTSVSHRYFIDDVRYGLGALEAVASNIGVRSRVISAIVSICETVTGLDLRTEGAEIARLLLNG